jgi:hypothetical protein
MGTPIKYYHSIAVYNPVGIEDNYNEKMDWTALNKIGIKLQGEVTDAKRLKYVYSNEVETYDDENQVFLAVPADWTRTKTEYSVNEGEGHWWHLLDGEGNQRALSYANDHLCYTSFYQRFHLELQFDEWDGRDPKDYKCSVHVLDRTKYNNSIFETEHFSVWQLDSMRKETPDWHKFMSGEDDQPHYRGIAETWLDTNYPDWKNPTAYWSTRYVVE